MILRQNTLVSRCLEQDNPSREKDQRAGIFTTSQRQNIEVHNGVGIHVRVAQGPPGVETQRLLPHKALSWQQPRTFSYLERLENIQSVHQLRLLRHPSFRHLEDLAKTTEVMITWMSAYGRPPATKTACKLCFEQHTILR